MNADCVIRDHDEAAVLRCFKRLSLAAALQLRTDWQHVCREP